MCTKSVHAQYQVLLLLAPLSRLSDEKLDSLTEDVLSHAFRRAVREKCILLEVICQLLYLPISLGSKQVKHIGHDDKR